MTVEQTKEQLIGILYTLRAGLSVVVQQKEKADAIINEANARVSRSTNDLKAKMDAEDEKVEKIEKTVKADQEHIKSLSHTKYYVFSTDVFLTIIFGLLMIGALLFVLYGVFFIVISKLDSAIAKEWLDQPFWNTLYGKIFIFKNDEWGFRMVIKNGIDVLFYLIILPASVLLLVLFVVMFAKKMKYISDALNKKRNVQYQLSNAEQQLKLHTKELDDARTTGFFRRLDEIVKHGDPKYVIIEAKNKATPYLEKGRKLAQALNDTFCAVIDCRDWENIDLILYALETRRADNMKEALAFVDGEKRANRIVNAVQQATITIRNSIQQASNRLANIMQNGITQLSNQLNSIERGVSGMRQEITSALETQNSQLGELCSKANMTNALLVKQNITSSRIAADVAAIRGTSDYFKDRLIHYPTY